MEVFKRSKSIWICSAKKFQRRNITPGTITAINETSLNKPVNPRYW